MRRWILVAAAAAISMVLVPVVTFAAAREAPLSSPARTGRHSLGTAPMRAPWAGAMQEMMDRMGPACSAMMGGQGTSPMMGGTGVGQVMGGQGMG